MNKEKKKIAKLQYITHPSRELSYPQLVEMVCKGGCRWVQLRLKNMTDDERLLHAKEVKRICDAYETTLIINDSPEIAKAVGAHGVHLGKMDMSPTEARKLLGPSYIIGGTANTFDDIQRLHEQQVDYIGLGPFRFTETKSNLSPVLGSARYQDILDKCKQTGIQIPVVAIGGIELNDISELLPTGVHGLAISGAIGKANNISEKTRLFIEQLD